MEKTHTKHKGTWRQVGILLAVSAVSIFLIVTALFADSPDSAKQASEDTSKTKPATRAKPNPVSLKALERLQANSTTKWNVQWDRETGLPGPSGGVLKTRYEGNAQEIALAFARDYKNLFLGIDDTTALAEYAFEVSKVFPEKRYTAVHLNQVYRGVKVHQCVLGVWISDEPWLNQTTNLLKPIQLGDISPSISTAQVEEVIRQAAAPDSVWLPSEFDMWLRRSDIPSPDFKGRDDFELVILPSSPPRLAYIGFRYLNKVPHRYIIDAHSGKIHSDQVWGNIDNWGPSTKPAEESDSASDSAGLMMPNINPSPLHQPRPMRPLPDVDKRGLDTVSPPPHSGKTAE